MTQLIRQFRPFLPMLTLAVAAACTEGPTATDRLGPSFAKGGPTNDCGFTPLSITFGDAIGDALRSDGNGAYVEGTDGGSHLNGATGRLMLWTSQYGAPSRVVNVTTTAFNGSTTDRIYTNNHETELPGDPGCGFKDMANGSTGSAVLEAELDSQGIVRYGKNCTGAIVPASKAVTTRSVDGLSWTIAGTSGVHCKKLGKKPALSQVGTAGPFSMQLVDITQP
jgi:hypothetical protein